jgi:hypothetical protein
MTDVLDERLNELAHLIDNASPLAPWEAAQRDALMAAVRGIIELHGLDPTDRTVYGTVFAIAVALEAVAANPTASLEVVGPMMAYAADEFRRRTVSISDMAGD